MSITSRAERKRNDYVGEHLWDLDQRFDDLRARGEVLQGDLHDLVGVQSGPLTSSHRESSFAVFSYEAAALAFRANDVFLSSLAYVGDRTRQDLGILYMDEPIHRRYRALVQPAFAVRTMQSWEHRWLEPTLDRLVADLPTNGPADLYADYAAKFPVATIVGGFGLAQADAERFHLWALQFGGGGTPEESAEAVSNFEGHLASIIDERRRSRSDDLIGLLATSEVTDEEGSHRLTNEEIYAFARLLITAGAGTTYRTFAFLLLQLAKHPDLYARARLDRDFVTPLVEETLRWSPPVTHFMRRTGTDTVLAGVEIPADSLVSVVVTAANHDPTRWARPHEWDPFRPLQAHLAFGFGPHFCIGNQLARMEMRTALIRLLDRYKTIELDPNRPEPRIDGLLFRFLDELPVVLRE